MRLHADRLNAPFGKQLIAVKRNSCDLLEATLWVVRLSKRTFDGFNISARFSTDFVGLRRLNIDGLLRSALKHLDRFKDRPRREDYGEEDLARPGKVAVELSQVVRNRSLSELHGPQINLVRSVELLRPG